MDPGSQDPNILCVCYQCIIDNSSEKIEDLKKKKIIFILLSIPPSQPSLNNSDMDRHSVKLLYLQCSVVASGIFCCSSA